MSTLDGNLGDPASHCYAITPNDSTDLAPWAQALYVGGAGDIVIHTLDGSSVTFVGVLAGSILPVRAKRVLATGTTATNIVGLV